MNNSLPLINVNSGSPAAASGSRAADSFSADVPFNKLLSSQVTSRNNEMQAQAQAHAQAPAPAPTPVQDKPRAAEEQAQDNQNAPQQAAAASASASAAKPAEKKSDDEHKLKDEDARDGSDEHDDSTTTQASAQMLALVANLEKNAVKPAVSGKSENTDADLLGQAKRVGPRQLGTAGDEHALGAESRGKKGEFAALQAGIAAAGLKKEAGGAELNQQNPGDALLGGKAGDKGALDLGANGKALPKDDFNALTSHLQAPKGGNVAPGTAELAATRQLETPLAAATTVATVPVVQQTLAASQPQAVFTPVYSDKINPNVGSAGWDQALGQKITWMVSGGIQSASLTLNPPDLGPMQVVLQVNNQQADATFITAQPEVKQALEQAMPRLREMMDQAGIQLGQATVNTGMPNQHQNAPQQQARTGARGTGRGGKEDEGELAAVTSAGSATIKQGGLGMVDTFV